MAKRKQRKDLQFKILTYDVQPAHEQFPPARPPRPLPKFSGETTPSRLLFLPGNPNGQAALHGMLGVLSISLSLFAPLEDKWQPEKNRVLCLNPGRQRPVCGHGISSSSYASLRKQVTGV